MTTRINPRARTREDRAGDPLDGLVNLFDLGIVLAVAFLLAALTSINLAPTILQQNADSTGATQVPSDSVVANPGEAANTIDLQPGAEVVGRGEPVGTVYQLNDGRTVIVRPQDVPPVPGENAPDDAPAGDGAAPGGPGADAPADPPSP